MDTRKRISAVIATLIVVPIYIGLLWDLPPYFDVETPPWLDTLIDGIALFPVVIGTLVAVGFAMRDVQRTPSIGVALFGFYMLSVGAIVVILVHAEAYQRYGLIQTVTNDCSNAQLTKIDYIYFSIITWTTVGYGDFVPKPASRMIAAEEAILGYIYMTVFISYMLHAVNVLGRFNIAGGEPDSVAAPEATRSGAG